MKECFFQYLKFLLPCVLPLIILTILIAGLLWRNKQQERTTWTPLWTTVFSLLLIVFGVMIYLYINAVFYKLPCSGCIISFVKPIFSAENNIEVMNRAGVSIFLILAIMIFVNFFTKTFSGRIMSEKGGWHILTGLIIVFVGVMVDPTYVGKLFGILLGTSDINNTSGKYETLEFIALIMGGVLAILGATTINRRARAQEDNNKMVEQGNKDYRFQNLVNNLGHEKTTVRVATFYRFYYLASKEKNNREESKEKKNRMVEKDVFEMLCSCLRVMFIEELDNKTTPDEQQMARQTLFDILFKGKFKSNDDMKSGLVHDEVKADLRNVCFTDIDFSDANLSEVDFRKAEFNNVNLDKIHSVKGADFRGAKILGMPIKRDDIPDNKGEYYANWNPPPEK